jgi:hypothetical protein
LKESDELIAIFVASVKTAKESQTANSASGVLFYLPFFLLHKSTIINQQSTIINHRLR